MKKSSFVVSVIPSIILFSSAEAAQMVRIDDLNFNQYFSQSKKSLTVKGEDSQYKLANQVKLTNGIIKNKYLQYYKGVPVYATLVSSSEINGGQEQWTGALMTNIAQDVPQSKPNFTAAEILAKAKKMLNVVDPNNTTLDKADLYIKQNKQTNRAELVYLVSFNISGDHPQRPHLFIDAITGKLLRKWDGLTTKDATGPGGNQKIGKYLYGTDFGPLVVSDQCQMINNQVATYNMNGRTSGEMLYQFTCPTNTYKLINGAYSPLNDAHFFGSVVYNMYKNWYNLDPLNMQLKMRVHYGQKYENAYWDGQQMTFGDGGNSLYPLTVLDVTGHEISHGVTEKNSNLEYEYQSGGINEAFSDMAGETCEYFMESQAGKENDWLIGAGIFKGPAGSALRYFKQPSLDGQSIDNASDYSDSMDVHYTSGVFNKAFYNLATQPEWGIRKAFEVFLLANRVYWKNDSNFDEAGCGVAKAANDLNYDVSDVVTSFKDVGVNANCVAPPTPTPNPSQEVDLQNGQVVTGINIAPNQNLRYRIQVPVVTRYPYSYKYLNIRLFDTNGDAKDTAELFIRYDKAGMVSGWQKATYKDEVFTVQLPAAGYYHILIMGKKAGVLSLQASYANK